MRKRIFHDSLGKYNLNLILDLTALEATVSRTKYSCIFPEQKSDNGCLW